MLRWPNLVTFLSFSCLSSAMAGIYPGNAIVPTFQSQPGGFVGGPIGIQSGIAAGGVPIGVANRYTNVLGSTAAPSGGGYSQFQTVPLYVGGYPGGFAAGQFKPHYVHEGGYYVPHGGFNAVGSGNGFNRFGNGYKPVGNGYDAFARGLNAFGNGYGGIGGGLIAYPAAGGGIVGAIAPSAGSITALPPHFQPDHHHQHRVVHNAPIGGEYVDRSGYDGANKNVNNAVRERSRGESGASDVRAADGYASDETARKDGKSASGSYGAARGDKKRAEDAKNYSGNERHDQQGKSAAEDKQQQSHRKGHKIHEFKNYHKKDESANEEEYFDEERDEGDRYQAIGNAGAYGQSGGTAYKGGRHDGRASDAESSNGGHHADGRYADKAHGSSGRFDASGHDGSSRSFGSTVGGDSVAFGGHRGAASLYNRHPFHQHRFY